MTPEAETLKDFMSELSEEAYSAGWMSGLEYALWYAVLNGPLEYGRLSIDEVHIERLKELAGACAGWIVFEDRDSESWVPMPEWVATFDRDLERVTHLLS